MLTFRTSHAAASLSLLLFIRHLLPHATHLLTLPHLFLAITPDDFTIFHLHIARIYFRKDGHFSICAVNYTLYD